MPSNTSTYNVYQVSFSQTSNIDHIAIALAPAQLADQGAGRFYDVTGTAILGMTYWKRPAFRFGSDVSFKEAVLRFQMPKAHLAEFEAIAARHPPPHDVRALFALDLDPPARNFEDWVNDVLIEARALRLTQDCANGETWQEGLK